MGKLIPIPIFPLPSILKGSKNLINVGFGETGCILDIFH